MICGRCGGNVPVGANICPNCGVQLLVNNNQVPMQQPYYGNNNQVPMQQPYYGNNTKNSSAWKWIIVFILLLIVVALLCLLLFSSNNGKKEKADEGTEISLNINKGTRTMMIYIIGSDLESDYSAATADIQEMMSSGFDKESMNIYIYTGGSKRWSNYEISPDENAIYKLTSDGIEKVKTIEKKSMVKADTLTEFIDYVYDVSKTDLYDLILWDHGGGPIIGYGKEQLYGDSQMVLSELNKALNNTKLMKNTKFELIGFDACLMGSLEIANVLKEEANYMVASEETEPGAGWDYLSLKGVNSSTTSEELGKKIVDGYYDYYMKTNDYYGTYGYNVTFNVSLSLLDLRKVDSVIEEIDKGFEKLSTDVSVTAFNRLSNSASKATIYGCQGDNCFDQVDLYNLIESLSSDIENVDSLKKAISNLIVYQKSNINGTNGVSIFFPVTLKSMLNSILPKYSKVSISKTYTNFLTRYGGITGGERFVKSSTATLTPSLNKDTVSVTLPDDLVSNYAKGDYSIFVANEYGGYFPVYRGKSVKLDGNVLSAKPLEKELVITDKYGKQPSFATSFEYQSDDTSTTYAVLAEFENSDLSNFKIEIAWFYVKFEKGKEVGEIIDIKPFETADEVAAKKTYNLNDWTHIMSISKSFQLEDKDGNALSTWPTDDGVYGYEYDLKKDGFQFRLKEFDKKKKYYYVFRVVDTQGNVHAFKKIELK